MASVTDVIAYWISCLCFTILAAASITGTWRADNNEWRTVAVFGSIFASAMSFAAFKVALETTSEWRRGRDQ